MMGLLLLILLFICLLCVVIFFVLVSLGNLGAMKFLAKNGVAVFCGDIDKDYQLLKFVNDDGVAWLNIPNVCYAPVMKNKNGFYRNHNFLQKENSHGELYISGSNTAKAMKQFAFNDNRAIKDLCVISGSPYSAGNSLRRSNFSNLRSYLDSAMSGTADDIEILDNKSKRRFRLAIAVDITKGAKQTTFKMNSRESLMSGLKDSAIWSSKIPDMQANMLLLRYYTNIDNLTLIFYEVK